MNISSIPFSLFSLETTLDLTIQCRDFIATRHPEENLLTKALADLEDPIQNAKRSISRDNKKELTKERKEADRKRDKLFICLRKHIEAELYNVTKPAAEKAAQRLLDIIGKHGNQLYAEGLSVQSALLVALFADLDSDSAKADILTLKLVSLLDSLKQAQSEFAAIQQQRAELDSAKDIATNEEARREIIEKLTVLFKGLDFLASTQSEKYAETASLVQNIVDELVTNERIRK